MIHQGEMSPWLTQPGQPDLNYNLHVSPAGREVSRRPGFYQQQFRHSRAGFRPSSHPVFKMDDRLQDGVSPAFLTLAPTFPPLDVHLIFNNGHQSWVGIVRGVCNCSRAVNLEVTRRVIHWRIQGPQINNIMINKIITKRVPTNHL